MRTVVEGGVGGAKELTGGERALRVDDTTLQRRPPPAAAVVMGGTAGEFVAAPKNNEPRSEWRTRLKTTFRTLSDDFVDAALRRLIYACRLPEQLTTSGIALSAALALIESMEPRNELEATIAVHVACLDAASSVMLGRLAAGASEHRLISAAAAIAKLERAMTEQLRTYHRLRHGHRQVIRIEKIEIQSGAQAVVGEISAGVPGGERAGALERRRAPLPR